MKAWEIERNRIDNAIPQPFTNHEFNDNRISLEKKTIDDLKQLWRGKESESGAPKSFMVSSIQSLENRGYYVENSEELLELGFKALDEKDEIKLYEISGLISKNIHNAKVNHTSFYWRYTSYHDFGHYCSHVHFAPRVDILKDDQLKERIYAGFLAQLIGATIGAPLVGYTTDKIKPYLTKFETVAPNVLPQYRTLQFELALLKAFQENGRNLSSESIALKWLGYLMDGDVEDTVALHNLRQGIFPPESGRFHNPLSDCILAQMRGALCGMLAPGDAREASRLAWLDAPLSNDNNGILGEVFNAILVALSFSYVDTRELITEALISIPKDSEFYHFANTTVIQCQTHDNWDDAWRVCEEIVREYNGYHVYPNVMAEIVALWFGNNDFTETQTIVVMCGQHVASNASLVLNVLGCMNGLKSIPTKDKKIIKDQIEINLRKNNKVSIKQLANDVFACI